MESTGHYYTPVVPYFEDKGYLIIIVNPLMRYFYFSHKHKRYGIYHLGSVINSKAHSYQSSSNSLYKVFKSIYPLT